MHGLALVKELLQVLSHRILHPLPVLLLASLHEIARGPRLLLIAFYAFPDIFQAVFEEGAARLHLRCPVGGSRGEEVYRIGILHSGLLCSLGIITIGLGDSNHIGHLHDAALDALQLIAGPSQHEKEEKIDHALHGGLALAHTHRLYDDDLKACCLAEEHALTGARAHTTERSARRRRADIGLWVARECIHTGLIAHDAATAALAARVDGKHGQWLVHACDKTTKGLYEGTLAHTRHACDAYPYRIARIGQDGLQNICGQCTVFGEPALDHRDGLAQHHAITCAYAGHIV